MRIKVTKDLCEIKENEIWNVGDYNVHTVQVELSPEFNGLVNKVRYFVEDKSYDMLITDNVAQVPYEATVMEGTIKIGVYGYDADTDILVQSTSPVNKYITSGTYTGDADNTQPLTPTDKEQMETAIQKNTNDITDLKANKQDKLISGVNIKTINNESILSGGNLTLVTEETDPIFTNSPAYSITDNDITYWNNKANMSDIPDVSNFITKDVDNLTYYTKSTDMQTAINNAVGNERNARENADNSLQNQIDAITVSSDVVDVVSTYQDLVDYDTQHIKANDIIKVMQDSTHDNAISYYRWVIVNHVGSWEYVGSEGPYYTKSETDTLLNAKQNTLVSGQNIKTINNESLLGEGNINIQSGGTSDYTDLTNKPKINNVELNGNKSLNELGIQPVGNYALESDMTEAQNDIDHLSKISNLFGKITGTGTSVTLNNTSDTILKIGLNANDLTQGDNPSPDYPQEIHTVTGDNEVKIEGKNLIGQDNISNLSSATGTYNGDTLTFISTGTYKKVEWFIPVKVGDTFTFSCGGNETLYLGIFEYSQISTSASDRLRAIEWDSNITTNGKTSSFTIQNNGYLRVYLGNASAITTTIENVMLEKNPTATSYEEHKEQTYPINLGSMELCKIGDYQDLLFKNTLNSEYYNVNLQLNKWYLKKNVGKVVLDGSESYTWGTGGEGDTTNGKTLYTPLKSNWNMKVLTYQEATTLDTNFIYANYFTGYAYKSLNVSPKKLNFVSIGANAILFNIQNSESVSTSAEFNTWLSTHNTEVYYVLATPTYTLLNDTLQTQLDNLQYALAYDTQTNISQTNTDLPFIIDAETYAKIKVDLTDYVKNTDYASSSTGGVIKTVKNNGFAVSSAGNLYAVTRTFSTYNSDGDALAISKGTLENVITGKELDLKQLSTFDSTKTQVLKNINGTLTWVDE